MSKMGGSGSPGHEQIAFYPASDPEGYLVFSHDFFISVYGSSCNSLFMDIFFFLSSTVYLAFHPALGMPIVRKRKK